jgi:transposase
MNLSQTASVKRLIRNHIQRFAETLPERLDDLLEARRLERVPQLSTKVSEQPTQEEVQAVIDRLNDLLAEMREAGFMK